MSRFVASSARPVVRTAVAAALVAVTLAPSARALADAPPARVDLRAAARVAVATTAPAEPAPSEANLAEPAPARRTTVFGLPRNVGPVDRVLRTVIGLGLIGLGAYGLASDEFSPTASGVMLGVSAVPLLTAATAYCPLYQAFGVDESF
jgi:hypothetical protein